MLSRREDFLAGLRKELHDYMPASFVIDNMNYPGWFRYWWYGELRSGPFPA